MEARNLVRANQMQDITFKLISRIKRQISDGTFIPGNKLPPERTLAKLFGVNRSSLRQALKVLQLMGVLSQQVGDGTYLNRNALHVFEEPLDFLILTADISDEELFDARLIVEPELAARAATGANSHDLAALRRAIRDMEDSRSDQTRIGADLAFHEVIFRASGNRICHALFSVIHRAILRSMARIAKHMELERPVSFHKAIYSAIHRRDSRQARRVMAAHLADSKARLLSSFRAQPDIRPNRLGP